MTESTIAGDYESKCVTIPMILNEGTITVTSRAYSSRGLYETVATFAAELRKGDPIALSAEKHEYEDTGGLSVATRISSSRKFRGRIVSEPKWIHSPPSSTSGSIYTNISGGYYRIADVELWGVTKVHACLHTTAALGDVKIGSSTGLAVSAASSYANHKVCMEDHAGTATGGSAGGAFLNLTYRQKAAAAGTAYTVLIGSPTGVEGHVHT